MQKRRGGRSLPTRRQERLPEELRNDAAPQIGSKTLNLISDSSPEHFRICSFQRRVCVHTHKYTHTHTCGGGGGTAKDSQAKAMLPNTGILMA